MSGYLSFTSTYVVDTNSAQPYGFLKIISTLAWGLGYFGMPHILLRFMAIEDENKLKISRRVASVWVVIAMAIAVLIGVVGKSLSDAGILATLSGSDSETIIIQLSGLLSKYGIFPALIAGLVLAGILASTMSTADSQLLAASSSVSENILQEALHLNLSRKASMIAARLTVIVIAILGIIIARDPSSSIFGIVSFAWAGFGAAFGPIVLFSLFWKRTTFPAAIAGMISGGAAVLIWKLILNPFGAKLLAEGVVNTNIFSIYELLPAFVLSAAVIVIVSLCTKKPSQEICDEFEQAKKAV